MSSKKNSTDEVKDYILAIEKKERKLRRKRVILGLSAVSMATVGFLWLKWPTSGYNYASINDLDIIAVDSILEKTGMPILVELDGQAYPETIKSLHDFLRIKPENLIPTNQTALEVVQIDSSTIKSELVTQDEAPSKKAVPQTKSQSKPLAMQGLDIAGDRMSGKALTFTVIGFKTGVSYEIDFGNGVKRIVSRSTTYTYPSGGKFRVTLSGVSSKHRPSVYRIPIEIGEKEAVEEKIASTEKKVKAVATADASLLKPLSKDATSKEDVSLRTLPKIEETLTASAKEDEVVELAEASGKKEEVSSAEKVKTLTGAVVQPSYPGGTKAMRKFIQQKLLYPSDALNKKIEGKVYVSFIVDKNGKLLNPTIVKGIGHGCDEEVLRIVSEMPTWVPGNQGGEVIPMNYTIPITFNIR